MNDLALYDATRLGIDSSPVCLASACLCWHSDNTGLCFYLRAFSMLLSLVCARRATDTDHGDRAVAQAEQRKQCTGQEGGPWAGGSHILYTSILELIIALNSLIKHPLREQNLNKPVVISRTALRRLRRARNLHSASSTPSSRPSPLQDGDGV